MRLRLSSCSLFFGALAMLFCIAAVVRAQGETPKTRLRNPAKVTGFIGGESQDHYVIRARTGRTMTVRISWRKEEDNTAGFSVTPASSTDGEPLTGRESNNGKTWVGRIPKTGDYIISVVAHPSAKYRLRVAVK